MYVVITTKSSYWKYLNIVQIKLKLYKITLCPFHTKKSPFRADVTEQRLRFMKWVN